jgi:hypothetical protein
MKGAKRRYVRDMAIAGVVYLGVVYGAVTLIRHAQLNLPYWAVIMIALTPVAPALMMLRAYLIYFRAVDEFNRRIQSEAWLITAGVVGLSCFTYSFLEEWAHLPRIGLIWVFPALIMVWGAATFLVRRRYQ